MKVSIGNGSFTINGKTFDPFNFEAGGIGIEMDKPRVDTFDPFERLEFLAGMNRTIEGASRADQLALLKHLVK